MVIGKNQVIEKSNLMSQFDNSDHDGDNVIAAAMHSKQARADFKYAFVKNLVEFEHMDKLLIDYEHESIYSAFMLTLRAKENLAKFPDREIVKLNTLDELVADIDLVESEPGRQFYIKEFDRTLSYVEWLIHISLFGELENSVELLGEPFYEIEKDGILNKKNLLKLTERFWAIVQELNSKDIEFDFWLNIHEFDKFLLECSTVITHCNPSFDLKDFAVGNKEIEEFKNNLFKAEPFLAFHQNMILFEKVKSSVEEDPENILNLVFNSGARLKSVQLLKAASNSGIPTDIYGKAFEANISNSLLDGLTEEEYFMTGDSARLALAQRQEAIPKGGELQRKFFFTTGILKLDKELEDCGTDKYFKIHIKNKNVLKLLNHRWWWNDATGKEEKIDINDESLIGLDILIRSPITCKHSGYRICKKCFGSKIPDSVNLGAIIGSGLSEGIIQSVLRTHHFGGAFIATEDKKLLDILREASFTENTITLEKSFESIGTLEDQLEYVLNYLKDIYTEEDIEINIQKEDAKIVLAINVINLPFNDDSVKTLNSIVSLIDKNREGAALIDPSVLYDKLSIVIEQNDILSVYLELIISLLYYDEDDILYRYSEKEPVKQVALKNIIEMLDPKLSIFYNFSNRAISKIYTKSTDISVEHMYHDLLEIYK